MHLNEVTKDKSQQTYLTRFLLSDFVLDGKPTADLYRRFIYHTDEALATLIAKPTEFFQPTLEDVENDQAVLDRFLGAPKGCMINSCAGAAQATANAMRRLVVCKPTLPHLDGNKIYVYKATRLIKIGEEIFTRYKNTSEKQLFLFD